MVMRKCVGILTFEHPQRTKPEGQLDRYSVRHSLPVQGLDSGPWLPNSSPDSSREPK